jgi:hypothetical protein
MEVLTKSGHISHSQISTKMLKVKLEYLNNWYFLSEKIVDQ